MKMNWRNVHKLIDYSAGGIVSKQIVKTDKLDVTLFCMAKNSSLSEHTASKSGAVFVLEGKGVFVLEGKKIAMEQGVLINMRKKAVHSLKAEKNTAFLLFLFD